jgi:uncharacterized membrane protein
VKTVPKLLLWLFVINLAISVGAGLYESRIQVPEWIGQTEEGVPRWDAEAATEANTGLRFWAFVSTGPLTLLTIANLYFGWRARGEPRRWWLAAGAVALGERAFTFSYFIPTMIGLMGMPTGDPEAAAIATQWASLNNLRSALSVVAFLASLKALTSLYYAAGAAAGSRRGER